MRVKSCVAAAAIIAGACGWAWAAAGEEKVCLHPVMRDKEGKILSWYEPGTPGAGYVEAARLASEFMKSGVPKDPNTGEPLYYMSCCFQGPHVKGEGPFREGRTWEDWPNNPACMFAGLVQGLVLDWRVYSGDEGYVDLVKGMLDHQLKYGTTPAEWPWASVPYASGNPGTTVWEGATKWANDGMRGDGLHGIEPDKVGELGIAYLKFYEVTEDKKYLGAAINCADALARHVRTIPGNVDSFSRAEVTKSPWPFRVNAETGAVISEYCSNVIEPIRLFDELMRIQKRIGLDDKKAEAYKKARDLAWKWLYSKSGPMKTYIWNAYFEDIPNDPERSNRNQITPMETARYLIKHPELDPNLGTNVPALIYWVISVFGDEGFDAIKEQTWCYAPMGSHTARYAGVCAMWYERTKDAWFKEQAYRFFNFATYMTYKNGVVAVGPAWLGSWFSDGYGDYIRHFMEGIAAVPEWAPAGEDHLLRSTSVVQRVAYGKEKITYRTFDDEGMEVLRIAGQAKDVKVNGKAISEVKKLDKEGWVWEPLDKGGVLRVRHGGAEVEIAK